MKMRHKTAAVENAEKVYIESHKSVDVTEYIVYYFMHKTRHILSTNAQS